MTKTINSQSDRIDKMDAFTQYLEDELNQAQATIARLQDELNFRTPPTMSPVMGVPLLQRQMTRVPSEISADIAGELQRYNQTTAPLRMEDLNVSVSQDNDDGPLHEEPASHSVQE